jgi:phosphoserine phosphatase
MGNTLLDRKLEKMLADQMADRKLAEEKLRNEVQSVNDRLSKEVKSVDDSCKSVNDSVKQLTGWHKGQTESFEVLATSIFKQHMVKPVSQGGLGYDEGEIYELQRGQLKVLGKHPG